MALRTSEQHGRVVLIDDADLSVQFMMVPEMWAELEKQIKAKSLDPSDNAAAGYGFVQPDPIWYGEGEHDYVAVTFEGGSVVFRDGNDPTGRATQISARQWAQFVQRVRGEESEEDKDMRGDKKDPSQDGFTAGVDGDKSATDIAQEKSQLNDRVTDQPASGGESPETQQRRQQTTEETSGSSRRAGSTGSKK